MKKIQTGIVACVFALSCGTVFAQGMERGNFEERGGMGRMMASSASPTGRMMGSSTIGMRGMMENSDKQIMGKVVSVSGTNITVSAFARNKNSKATSSVMAQESVSYIIDARSAKITKDGQTVTVSSLAENDMVHIVLSGKITEIPKVATSIIVMSARSPQMMNNSSSSTPRGEEMGRGHMFASTTQTAVTHTQTGVQEKRGVFQRIESFFTSFFR